MFSFIQFIFYFKKQSIIVCQMCFASTKWDPNMADLDILCCWFYKINVSQLNMCLSWIKTKRYSPSTQTGEIKKLYISIKASHPAKHK